MTLNDLNSVLATMAQQPGREAMRRMAFALLEFMGLRPPREGNERLILPAKQELKRYLATHPLTRQHQVFRMTDREQNIMVRLAVIKKLHKVALMQLIDKENNNDFQKAPPFIQGRPSAPPYFIHFVTTEAYDRLYIVLHKGDQKRILALRGRLTQTQYTKIFPQWENIAAKSKPEIAELLWKSLDLKEVNRDFYKLVKQEFDSLIGIAKQQSPEMPEKEVKQFAVRLIVRYIFCWFLKEKGIIGENLLSGETISQTNDYCKSILIPLFFNTLNTPVPEREISPLQSPDPLVQSLNSIPYLNGGLFDKHPEDNLFERLQLDSWLQAFVKVLESFDFTVDESSTQYQQVSIDPEMLGRIFENLLASQNEETEKLANQRKAFGAFYTPREIVDYMVNESLKAHIETHLLPPLPGKELENKLEEPMVAYRGTLFAELEPRQTILPLGGKEQAAIAEAERKREQIKKKIERLFASDCTENPFDKEETQGVRRALNEVTVLDPACGSGAFPMGMLLRLMELRQIVGHGHRNNYDLKSEILSKNIFGVDIMPMAVEIARLRAWLSLVLEADYKPADRKNNFGVAALPNLDFKFVCANSLIDSGYDAFLENVPHNATLYRLDGEIQKLEKLREDYYDPKGDKARKEDLQKEFNKTKAYIKTEFASLKKAWKLEDFLSKVDDWDPFDDSKPSSFFSPAWMFGIRDGFDIVIGNPPYVPMESLSDELRELYKKKYNLFYRKYETSVLFIVEGLNKLNRNGVLSFIAPMTWQTGENYSRFRKYILKEKGLISILNLPFDVFEAAYVDTGVCLLSNKTSSVYSVFIFDKKEKEIDLSDIRYEKINTKEITGPDYKLVLDKNINSIDIRLKGDKFISLGKITKSTQGLSGSRFLKIEEGARGDDIFPFLQKGNVFNYQLKIEQIYLTDLSEKQSLKQFYQAEPKVLIRRIINRKDRLSVSYCDERIVFKKDINPFIPIDKQYSAKFLLAILTSALISKIYINRSSIATKDDFRQTTLSELRKLPIPNLSQVRQKPFISMVDEILNAKEKEIDTTYLEEQIDIMVYRLYDLTHEEVKMIEPEFGMSKEEYERFEAD